MTQLTDLATALRAKIDALDTSHIAALESAVTGVQTDLAANTSEDAVEKAQQDDMQAALTILLTPSAPVSTATPTSAPDSPAPTETPATTGSPTAPAA